MRRSWALASPLLTLALAASCSSEDTSTASSTTAPPPTAGADLALACDAYIGLTAAFAAETPADFEHTIQPLLEVLTANQPPPIAAELDVMVAAATSAANGDTSEFETEAFATAKAAVDQFTFAECDAAARLEVAALDYRYDGIPSSVDAGRVALHLTNESTAGEAHEIVLLRRNDGESASFTDILSLPENEAQAKVTPVGSVFAPSPDQNGIGFFDLDAGSYALVCFIPQGASEAAPEGTGPPHFTLGMLSELTVE